MVLGELAKRRTSGESETQLNRTKRFVLFDWGMIQSMTMADPKSDSSEHTRLLLQQSRSKLQMACQDIERLERELENERELRIRWERRMLDLEQRIDSAMKDLAGASRDG